MIVTEHVNHVVEIVLSVLQILNALNVWSLPIYLVMHVSRIVQMEHI